MIEGFGYKESFMRPPRPFATKEIERPAPRRTNSRRPGGALRASAPQLSGRDATGRERGEYCCIPHPLTSLSAGRDAHDTLRTMPRIRLARLSPRERPPAAVCGEARPWPGPTLDGESAGAYPRYR